MKKTPTPLLNPPCSQCSAISQKHLSLQSNVTGCGWSCARPVLHLSDLATGRGGRAPAQLGHPQRTKLAATCPTLPPKWPGATMIPDVSTTEARHQTSGKRVCTRVRSPPRVRSPSLPKRRSQRCALCRSLQPCRCTAPAQPSPALGHLRVEVPPLDPAVAVKPRSEFARHPDQTHGSSHGEDPVAVRCREKRYETVMKTRGPELQGVACFLSAYHPYAAKWEVSCASLPSPRCRKCSTTPAKALTVRPAQAEPFLKGTTTPASAHSSWRSPRAQVPPSSCPSRAPYRKDSHSPHCRQGSPSSASNFIQHAC